MQRTPYAHRMRSASTPPLLGGQASVETFSYQTGWFADACFPAAATRRAIAPAGAAQHGAAGAVRVECRDRGGVRVNGVLYGRACLENAPCGRAQHLVPRPESCGLRLANETMRARASAMRTHSGAASCATPWLAAAPGDRASAAGAHHPDGRNPSAVVTNAGAIISLKKGTVCCPSRN